MGVTTGVNEILARWGNALHGGLRKRKIQEKYMRALEEQLLLQRGEIDRARDETDRERAELARERAEVARERNESARLREENRAMLNSLLGLAGVPPVEVTRGVPGGAATIRRRSWPQMAATREIEAARKAQKREEAE